jgi:hypothetical protein
MPLGQPIISKPVVYPVVTEIVEEALLHTSSLGISMDIPQRVQSSFVVIVGEACTMIPFLPEVTCTVEHTIKTHGLVPIEPVHDLG